MWGSVMRSAITPDTRGVSYVCGNQNHSVGLNRAQDNTSDWLIGEQPAGRATTLADLDELHERIRRWREEHGVEAVDSAELIREMRKERTDALAGVR